MNQRRILVVSASAGTGHVRAADAVHAAVRAARPDWSATHIDVLDLSPRWVRSAYGGGFELIASRAPRVWRGIYQFADGPDADRARWGGAARRVLFRSFDALLSSERWDHVICTHFLPAQLAAGRRADLPPFTLVVTDFTLHRYWVQPRVTRNCVATTDLAAGIRQRLPVAQVSATGIPIDHSFSIPVDQQAVRAELGLSLGAPIALIVGGGLGIGVEAAVRECLRSTPDRVQLVAICGRNEDALARLSQLEVPRHRLACFGYVTGIERWFAAADVVVTKPGGLTCSEALAGGKPLVLTRPIPGHEEGNVRFLVEAGAVLNACTPDGMRDAMRTLFDSGARLKELGRAALTLGRPHAAEAVTQQVIHELEREVAA